MSVFSLRALFLATVLLFHTSTAAGSSTDSLEAFLVRANDAGLKILFSSDLISPRYTVTFDPGQPVTLQQVRQALAAFDLGLVAQGDIWLVQRTGIEAQTEAPEVPPPAIPLPAIEEMVVTSSHYKLLMRDRTRAELLDHEELHARPVAGNDAVRIVNQLPGSATNGVSGRPRVRGGHEDETLVLFDGVRLGKPFHFGSYNSLFSSFDNRIIDSLEFYTGGFPAKYGDRLSAAMVIEPVIPDADVRELGLGLVTASYLQSAARADRQWLIAARRSSLEIATELLENDPGTPVFADLFASYRWQPNASDEFSASLLWFGDDTLINTTSESEVSTSVESNTNLWLKWARTFSDRLFAESWATLVIQKSDRDGVISNLTRSSGEIEDKREFRAYGLKQAFEYTPWKNRLVEFGWDYRFIEAEYEIESELDIAPAFASLSNFPRPAMLEEEVSETGHQLALYSSLRQRLLRKLTMEIGVRYDFQHYEHGIHDYQFSPRVNLLFEPVPSTQLRLGWGRFSQAEGLQELNVSDGLLDFQATQQAEHTVLGISHSFGNGIDIKLEAYQKRSREPDIYFDNLTDPLSLLPELQADRVRIETMGSLAQGIELSVAGNHRGYSYWANYSYSTVKDLVGSDYVRRSWDQNRAMNVGLGHAFGGWQTAATLAWHDGWQTTPLTFDGNQVRAAARNSASYGSFTSLDIKTSQQWHLNRSQLRLEIGITNLLGRENIGGIEYQLDSGQLTSITRKGLPLLPFVDLYWRF
ncbi:MAG: TonB-dependent receptor plug domain-containing protein [Pseudomonadota bacterium]